MTRAEGEAPLSQERERGIRERLAAAQPGPWGWTDAFPLDEPGLVQATRLATEDFTTVVGCPQANLMVRRTDADFIANAPSDIAALLAELERLRRDLDWHVENRKLLAAQVGAHDPTGADHLADWCAALQRIERLEGALREALPYIGCTTTNSAPVRMMVSSVLDAGGEGGGGATGPCTCSRFDGSDEFAHVHCRDQECCHCDCVNKPTRARQGGGTG